MDQIFCTYGDLTETKEIVATYDAGTSNSSETSSSTEVNQDGSTMQTTTTTTYDELRRLEKGLQKETV